MAVSKRTKWVAFAIVVLGLIGLDLMPYFDYLQKKNTIKRLVPIGSNIDDAKTILRQNGFDMYSKGFATVAEDRYWMEVKVKPARMPICVAIGYLVGIRMMSRLIVIEADLENKVQRIF